MDDKTPPGCPYCCGEREWSGFPGVAACYFCGRSEKVLIRAVRDAIEAQHGTDPVK